MIKHFASLAEMHALWRTRCASDLRDTAASWYGGETGRDTDRLCQTGDTSLLPEAERLMSSLDAALETPRRAWERASAGAFCSVPDYLSGLPTPMRRQTFVPDERAPVNILVITTSSVGINASTLRKRGTVILALTMALSRVRPVNLMTLATLHGMDDGETVFAQRINTTPLDLATACYCLTSAGYARRVTYGLAEALNRFDGSWPRAFNYGSPQRYYDSLVPRLGFAPKDTLLIGGAELRDALLKDSLGWVQNQINHFVNLQEEESLS